MRDSTYLVLLQKAMGEGKTMGKFLNEVLDKYVVDMGFSVLPNICKTCACLDGSGRCELDKKYKKFQDTCDKWKERGLN
jgi:hypothetical protein